MSVATEQGTAPELSTSDSALSVRNLWKIFGKGAENIIGTPDADLSRADLKSKTGCVVGSRPVAETSREEILRLIVMGREAAA